MPSTNAHKNQDLGDISRQRASKACNRCRAKKARCSGGYPCSKCKSSDAVCIFGYLKKSKRRTFPENYVRALEMQQFKLVAGLQTMYFMLLAANSWPGAQLTERKGNPLVHDILDRLGLLVLEKDRNLKLEMDDNNSDHPSSSDGALIVKSPQRSQRSQREIEMSPKPRSRDFPASPQRMISQQQTSLQASDSRPSVDSQQSQTMQSHPNLFRPLEPPAEFLLNPPVRMTTALPSTSPPRQSLEATNRSAIGCVEPWWQEDSQVLQETLCSNVNFAPAVPGAHMATDKINSVALAPYYQSSYLTDLGVYTCDFDVE